MCLCCETFLSRHSVAVLCGYCRMYILIVITWFYTCTSLSMQSASMCSVVAMLIALKHLMFFIRAIDGSRCGSGLSCISFGAVNCCLMFVSPCACFVWCVDAIMCSWFNYCIITQRVFDSCDQFDVALYAVFVCLHVWLVVQLQHHRTNYSAYSCLSLLCHRI